MNSFKTIDEMSLEELENALVDVNLDINFIREKICEYSSQLHMKRVYKNDLEYRIKHYDEMYKKD